ncbi:MAG: type II toxin-antitoxin system RelE/ParE family toxin [Bacteroidetes bacterium]|nr:MAG: type II toxin-antitoxin system RelE/ParE family toxin [Bacteroidota bacterium]
MALKTRWTTEAEESFKAVIEYLEYKWTEKEVRNFVRKTNEVIKQIEKHPYQYKASSFHEIRIAIISKHNSLIYYVNKEAEQIELYTFWDHRKDPSNFKY